jgi:hypothetical protein
MLLLGCAVMLVSTSAVAAETRKAEPRAEAFEALVRCRTLADDAARLQCFDGTAAKLEEAAARKELVVIDKKQIRETKRTLFGLALPDLGLFGSDDEADEVKQIEGVLAGVGYNRDGGYTFRLADGARWSQTDSKPIALKPRAGNKVVVKRGMLGSYSMSIAGQPAVKVERIN